MSTPDHSLLPCDSATAGRARRWLLLGAAALGAAGVFAGLLANAQSHYFDTALTLHVDLSVLVWFLTMACMLFTLAGQGRGSNLLADSGFISFTCGTALIILSGLTGGEAFKSNYIPVIYHPAFFLGLALLFCGVALVTINFYLAFLGRRTETVPQYGTYCAGLILLYAAGCFLASYRGVPRDIHGEVFYEFFFWDGGHILQFVHTQFMLVCWLWLAQASGLQWKIRDRIIELFFLFGVLAVSYWVLYIFIRLPDVVSDEHRNAFTLMMRDMNGFAPLFLGGFIVWSLLSTSSPPHPDPLPMGERETRGLPRAGEGDDSSLPKITLIMSILLFTVGGALGYAIRGSNVIVPAHYHGSIIGITLAFMGVSYLLLPAFGWADVSKSRLAFWQPVIYGGGQLCWMLGMAILGAHGVPRKTPGSADTMGAVLGFLKHAGDGMALIGGLLFVFIVLSSVYRKPKLG